MQFKKETYSSKAAEFIRNLIRSGELLPGRPVREALITAVDNWRQDTLAPGLSPRESAPVPVAFNG